MGCVVALDPGFGNTKVCVAGKVSIIPSVVVQPKRIGLAGLGMKSAFQAIEVAFDGLHFMAGQGALAWGIPQSNLDYSALLSPERKALFYAALAALLSPGITPVEQLVVGLPVPLLQDEDQAALFLSELKSLKGSHSFRVGELTFRVVIEKLKVVPQPLGAYADWLLDDELKPRKNAAQAEAAVLDIGMNTVDLYAIRGGRVEPRFVSGGKVGVRRLLEKVDEDGRDLEELDSDLRQRKLSVSPVIMQSWLSEVMSTIEKTMPNLSRFSVVIPAGGGAVVLGDTLRLYLASRGAAIYWPPDPIGCNARGLWKWSVYGGHR